MKLTTRIVCIGISNPLQRDHAPLFWQASSLICKLSKTLLFRQSSYVLVFCQPSLKSWVFRESLLKFSILNSISSFLSLSSKYFHILVYFLCKNCNSPWKKSPPLILFEFGGKGGGEGGGRSGVHDAPTPHLARIWSLVPSCRTVPFMQICPSITHDKLLFEKYFPYTLERGIHTMWTDYFVMIAHDFYPPIK